MDVEIEDRDPLDAVPAWAWRAPIATLLNRQKPPGMSGVGVMAGRPDRGEGGVGLAAHHRIDAGHDRAGGAQRGLGAAAGS